MLGRFPFIQILFIILGDFNAQIGGDKSFKRVHKYDRWVRLMGEEWRSSNNNAQVPLVGVRCALLLNAASKCKCSLLHHHLVLSYKCKWSSPLFTISLGFCTKVGVFCRIWKRMSQYWTKTYIHIPAQFWINRLCRGKSTT